MRARQIAAITVAVGLSFGSAPSAELALRAAAAGAPIDAPEETIRLDVIVTDRGERLVRDLHVGDFELNDSGEPRQIDSVTLVPAGGTRLVAIFLDEYHVDAGDSTLRARAALRQFVDAELRPDDLVAIMKPLDPLNSIQLSTDRAALHAAIDAFEGRRADYTARSPFEEKFISRAPRTADASRAQVVTAALQALTLRIGEVRAGRKAVVLVSQGFTPALPRGSDRLMGSARAIAYAANRFGVSIYPMSPRLGQPAATDNDGTEPERATAMLRLLAEQTGGNATIDQRDLAPGLRRVVQDLDGYYVVTYRAPRASDGKFHPIDLHVKRENVQARVRSGYWAANATLLRSTANAARASGLPARAAHASPYIRPWIGTSRGPDGLTRITVTWEPGKAPPKNQRLVAVVLKVIAEDGALLFEDRIAASQVASFNAPPGSIGLEMALQASGEVALDTDYRGMRVPDLRVSKPTFATAQLMRTRSARAFTAASADPDAVPTPSREFSRAERILLRIPVYTAGGAAPVVTAELLNRIGAPMRPLAQLPGSFGPEIVQFDLPLASLAPDEYRIELVARQGNQEAKESSTLRVVN